MDQTPENLPKGSKFKRRIKFFLISFPIFIVLSLFVVLFTPVVTWLYNPLLDHEAPKKSEVIVILTVGVYPTEEGMPDFSTLKRLHKGLELYRKGYANKIICIGGSKLPNNKSYGQVMKETLMLYQVPEANIYVQDKIPGDWNYYLNLIDILESYKGQFDFNNALIVTSPYNTYRIKKSFLKKGFTPTLVASAPTFKHPKWWNRFELLRDIANEYIAITMFYITGRI